MKERGYPMCPYVRPIKDKVKNGLYAYLETPRYSTGYAALFNTIGFVSETHMLKPYEERVESTEAFFNTLLSYAKENGDELVRLKERADSAVAEREEFGLRWELDSSELDSVPFKGYTVKERTSDVTGQKVRYYDRSEPWEAKIPFYNTYETTLEREKPSYYVVPQAWKEVVNRLHRNQIRKKRLQQDTTIEVTSYMLRDVKTIDRPYEGRFLHRDVRVEVVKEEREFYEGDYLVPTGTEKDRFIVNTLEPEGVDSYFAWNFFDEVLMQKEYFSSYLFDPKAEKILEERPDLKEAFQEKKAQDSTFAGSHRAQLRFIYRRSKHYEDAHRRYPVARIE
jgi:hypothetical protein